MEFSPFNNIVRLCMQGMEKEEQGKMEEASKIFLQGWDEASTDFEKFLTAHYIARHQLTTSDKSIWLEAALDFALKVNDNSANSALPTLYLNIAKCYEELGNIDKAKVYYNLSNFHKDNPSDIGPFYHGTKANLNTGDYLIAGGNSNYKNEFKMNHIYFTALLNGAGLAAALAKGEDKERVYIVEPIGNYENDPNLTDKKFPGNPTRSYRSEAPLKIIGEVTDWERPKPEDLQKFREKLKNNNGEIIN